MSAFIANSYMCRRDFRCVRSLAKLELRNNFFYLQKIAFIFFKNMYTITVNSNSSYYINKYIKTVSYIHVILVYHVDNCQR